MILEIAIVALSIGIFIVLELYTLGCKRI